jgi:hypothetical protein
MNHLAGVSLFLGGMAVVFCTACGSSSAPAMEDAGKETGTHVDSGKPSDAGEPFSACGHPGDKGNSLGIGQYCTASTDCPGTAPICSNIENSDADPTLNTFFCVIPCTGCEAPGFCGSGASCVCEAPDKCGCTPVTCSAIIPEGGLATCPPEAGVDSGTKDAGGAG